MPPVFRGPISARLSLSVRVLRAAASSTGYSLEELFGLEGLSAHDFPPGKIPESGGDYDPVPFGDTFPVRAAAGAGAEVLAESRASHIRMEPHWLRSHALNPDFCDVISVSGDSMEPTLPDGSSILVDRASTELRDGAIFVVQSGEGLAVKRVRAMNDVWILVDDNPARSPVPLDLSDIVIGEVRWTARMVS